jgi:penicillin-binding protein 1C
MHLLKAVLLRLLKNKVLLSLIFFLTIIYAVPLPQRLRFSKSRIVRFNDGSVMRVYLSSDEKYRIFLPIESIDPKLVKTTILYEDRFFYYHFGINPFSILRAIYLNLKET